jgi:D-3-phosphoglycerate dehydrogenase
MLASTGAILAERGINIAGVSLGRLAVGGEALTIMNVDSPVPDDLLRRIEVLDGVSRVRVAIIE